MAVTPRRSRSPTIRLSAAAAAARLPPASRMRISSTSCSWPIRTTRCCASRTAASSIGKVYQLPQASRGSRGKPIVHLLPLQEGERISAMLSIKEFEEGKFVFMATSLGTVKKTSLALFSRPRASGIIAVALEPGDKLVGVAITDGTKDILLFTTGGKAIRFLEEEVRAMGREAAGVRGVRLSDEQRVNALIVAEQGFILTASQNGFGKLTPLDDFPKHGRGGQGRIGLPITDRHR